MDEKFVIAVKLSAPYYHTLNIDSRRTLLLSGSDNELMDVYSSLEVADKFSLAKAKAKNAGMKGILMVDESRVLSVTEAESILARETEELGSPNT